MKKLTVTFTVFVVLLISHIDTIGQNTSDAVTYMNNLFQPIDELKNETWQYLKAITRGRSARRVESKRKKLVKEIKTQKSVVNKQKDFEGNDSLRLVVLEYLEFSYTVLKEDYDKILDMEEIAEQSYDNMEAYMLAREKANDKLHEAFNEVIAAQKKFAALNNIILMEAEIDKKTEKIIKANNALKYYNKAFLIFFKCNKQEMYVLDALKREDVSGMQQNISALNTLTDEAFKKLEELEDYEGDNSLKDATKEILMFFKKEAVNDFPAMIKFFLKKDEYEKFQKSMKSKTVDERTRQVVDHYNKVVKDFNNRVNSFNQTNELANMQRSKCINTWNNKVDQFLSTHSK